MSSVNITEKYILCILKEKKNLYNKELTPYLIAAIMLEMMLDDNLIITDKNKVILNNKIPSTSYSKKLYEVIKDMKKDEVSLKYILSSICYSFSTKNLKNIVNEVKDCMLKDKLISIEMKNGLFGDKESIKVDEDKFSDIIKEIKTEFLEKESLTDDLILLSTLLNYTKFLKNIFNKYEKEKLESKLKEISNTEIAQKVKVAQSVICNMHAVIASMMVVATTQV